jgi:RNA ligase
MDEYQKIPSPFRRNIEKGPDRNKLIWGDWISPEVAQTNGLGWNWTEKVDGTNIRVGWDGHKVSYGGRTDNASLPAKLLPVLDGLFPEELFEQVFNAVPVTLYGEGYGAGIQSGGLYRPAMSFVLFDVRIDGWWLRRPDVVDVATKLGCEVVALVTTCTIYQAIDAVRAGQNSFLNPEIAAEGLVGVTTSGLCARDGERLIVKVKAKDFR